MEAAWQQAEGNQLQWESIREELKASTKQRLKGLEMFVVCCLSVVFLTVAADANSAGVFETQTS
jgi:hypothetical protein